MLQAAQDSDASSAEKKFDWKYVGCYNIDNPKEQRISVADMSLMTPTKCASACKPKREKEAGAL